MTRSKRDDSSRGTRRAAPGGARRQRPTHKLTADGDSVLLPLRGGGHTLVDRDVAERLGGAKLHRSGGAYVATGRHEYLHHLVIGKPPRGWHTDHINGNPDDNRRCNLRHVSA
jgi:hypothetical protein